MRNQCYVLCCKNLRNYPYDSIQEVGSHILYHTNITTEHGLMTVPQAVHQVSQPLRVYACRHMHMYAIHMHVQLINWFALSPADRNDYLRTDWKTRKNIHNRLIHNTHCNCSYWGVTQQKVQSPKWNMIFQSVYVAVFWLCHRYLWWSQSRLLLLSMVVQWDLHHSLSHLYSLLWNPFLFAKASAVVTFCLTHGKEGEN